MISDIIEMGNSFEVLAKDEILTVINSLSPCHIFFLSESN